MSRLDIYIHRGQRDAPPEWFVKKQERDNEIKRECESYIARCDALMDRAKKAHGKLKKGGHTYIGSISGRAIDQVKKAKAHFGLAINNLNDTQKRDQWFHSGLQEFAVAERDVASAESDAQR
jgi:hypothetical protein